MHPKYVLIPIVLLFAGCASQPSSRPRGSSGDGASAAVAFGGGDGSSFANAVVIQAPDEGAGVKAEYAWIREHIPGAKSQGQALLYHGSRVYDSVHVTLPDGSRRDVYFDITGFFGKL